jgi:hypothetical protein
MFTRVVGMYLTGFNVRKTNTHCTLAFQSTSSYPCDAPAYYNFTSYPYVFISNSDQPYLTHFPLQTTQNLVEPQ